MFFCVYLPNRAIDDNIREAPLGWNKEQTITNKTMKKEKYLVPEVRVDFIIIEESIILSSSPADNGNGEDLGKETVDWSW